jgi:hypothetical protein
MGKVLVNVNGMTPVSIYAVPKNSIEFAGQEPPSCALTFEA